MGPFQEPGTNRTDREPAADRDSLVAEQIVQLLHRRPTLVWDLVEAPTHPQAGDVTIRDVAGAFVTYARPSVR